MSAVAGALVRVTPGHRWRHLSTTRGGDHEAAMGALEPLTRHP